MITSQTTQFSFEDVFVRPRRGSATKVDTWNGQQAV